MPTEILASPQKISRRRKIYYPEGDGRPMAETDTHVSQIAAILLTLRFWLREAKSAYAAANMLLYYQEGQPKRRISPDVFVVWGVDEYARRSYKLWEEKQAPQIVFEITSRKTREEDLGKKRLIYAQIGVEEYYLFDPFGQYLNPPLRGYQLVGEEYAPRTVETLARPAFNGEELETPEGWRLASQRLKLDLWALSTDDPRKPFVLRFYDPAARDWLVEPEQALVDREALAVEARESKAQLRAAEERAAQLEAELETLRREGGAK
ncbi:Uma2 family endonuclease [bacterium]|nr:Uma2 family endonuclease [bacterium]